MISKSKRGLILILSSPSGAGKTTLAKKIELSDRNFKISVSYTTRTPRTNEVDGVDYNFVTIKKFQELASQDKFLEQAKVFGNYYATLKGPIEDNLAKGIDYLFDIDWQGTEQVKKIMPSDIVSVFILPPSIEALEKRLSLRGTETPESLATRLNTASYEISFSHQFNHSVVNDDLATACAETENIITQFLGWK